MGIFEACADAGDSIVRFFRKGPWHAALIVVLSFISPVNIVMWILILCGLWRGRS